MVLGHLSRLFSVLGGVGVRLVWSAIARGVEGESGDAYGRQAPESRQQPVDLFSAISNKQVEVKFIARDDKQSVVRIENCTEQPVSVRLAEAFVGEPDVPYDREPAARTQTVGGSFPYEPMGRVSDENDGVMLHVEPGKEVQLPVRTVCLDPGLPPPRPDLSYQIRPVASHSANPALYELCRMLGQPGTKENASQAAAWYLDDGLSWAALGAMHTPSPQGRLIPVFTASDIRLAKKLAAKAISVAEQRQRHRDHPTRKEQIKRQTGAAPVP